MDKILIWGLLQIENELQGKVSDADHFVDFERESAENSIKILKKKFEIFFQIFFQKFF